MKAIKWFAVLVAGYVIGCATTEIKPVEIYNEDSCAQCKMALSDQAFASEVVARDGLVYKFDDIGCMEKFTKNNPRIQAAALFYKDFQSKQWMKQADCVVIRTGIKTPMGSGKIAVKDSLEAERILKQYPVSQDLSENESGCGNDCCGSKED